MASYKLINDILLSLNNKLWVGGIVCDLQKAFLLCLLKYIVVNNGILWYFR